MRFWIEVTDTAGTRTGRIDDLLYWRHTRRLDKVGRIEFALPAASAKASLLSEQYTVTCYAVLGGSVTEIGAGRVAEMETQLGADDAPVLTVNGPDKLRELVDEVVVGSTAVAPVSLNTNIIHDLLLTYASNNTWTRVGNATTSSIVHLRTAGDSILAGEVAVAAACGDHFRYDGARNLRWLGPASSFASSGILATANADPHAIESNTNACLITRIREIRDSWDLWTRAYPVGAGEGEARLDMRAVDAWPTGLTDITSGTTTPTWIADVAHADDADGDQWEMNRASGYLENNIKRQAYGYKETTLRAKNVAPISNTDGDLAAAANQLVRTAYHWLRTHDEPQRFYDLELTALDAVLDVGTTIRAMARKVTEDDDGKRTYIDIDRTLNILEATLQADANGVSTTGLMVSTTDRYPPTDESAAIEPMQQTVTMQAVPQINASADTDSDQDDVDPGHDATIRFWLDDEVTTVRQVILRFRLDALRSTIVDTDDNAGISHSHDTPIYGMTITTNVGLALSGVLANGGSSGSADQNIATNFGGFHSHPQHLGIEEEVSGNTYAESELDITINGGVPTNSVASEGDGWYSLDLTNDVKDSNNRPVQVKNDLVFSDNRTGVAISSISKSVVTVTVDTSTVHGLSSGDNVWIAGTSNYDGHHANITVTSTTQFTYTSLTGSGSESTGTVLKYKSARLKTKIKQRTTIQSVATI